MTELFLDTEFNGFGGALISMALVEDDTSWYEVLEVPTNPDPWVAQHVIPFLMKKPIGLAAFRSSFHSFLKRYDRPKIICDWHADVEHFCRMLAGADYGSSLDFPCEIRLLTGVKYNSTIPHNALADAQALKKWWDE